MEQERYNEKSNKAYICLLTCSSARTVHLKCIWSLNIQDFLLGFRRFSGRSGLPATITHDSSKTFKSSCKEIRKITRSNEIKPYLVNNRTTWNFLVEKALWWGGFWEKFDLLMTKYISLRWRRFNVSAFNTFGSNLWPTHMFNTKHLSSRYSQDIQVFDKTRSPS